MSVQLALQWAGMYGKYSPTQAVRHYGANLEQISVRLGNDEWRCSAGRHAIGPARVSGLFVVQKINHHGAGPKATRQWFFPWSELAAMTLKVKGYRVD